MNKMTQVGYASARMSAKVHAIASTGRAVCGSGRGVILFAVRDLAITDAGSVCKRCQSTLRKSVDAVRLDVVYAARNRYNAQVDNMLEKLIDMLMTAAERAEIDELVARFEMPAYAG